MALLRFSSPHAHGPARTSWVMQQVLLATVPGVLVLTVCFGWGTLVNILWAVPVALACEGAMLRLRAARRAVQPARLQRAGDRDAARHRAAARLAVVAGHDRHRVRDRDGETPVRRPRLQPLQPGHGRLRDAADLVPAGDDALDGAAAAGIAATPGPLEALQASLGCSMPRGSTR